MRKIRKKFIRLWIGIILSIAIQTIILYYLNNFYFTSNIQLTFKSVNSKPVVLKNLEINIESDAENITLSPSGKYCSYYSNRKLNIINLMDGSKNSLDLEKDLENYHFKWHNTEDKIIISEKTIENNKKGIKIYTYNTKTNTKQEALNYNNKSEVYRLSTSNSNVTGIELNTKNTIMYLKISNPMNEKFLQRLDISSGINKINVNTTNIGNFFVLRQKDELIYENVNNNKIYMTEKYKSKQIEVNDSEKLKLLKVDKNDNVFIGELENKMIRKVFKKNFDGTSKENDWQDFTLEKPTLPEDIYVLNSGNIYIIDNLKGNVENVENKNKVNFKGKFVTMNDNRILSSEEGKLIITSLKN